MGARMALLLAEGPFGISQLWLIARRRERLLSLQEQIRRRNPRIKVRCLEGDLLSDAFFDTFSAELSRELVTAGVPRSPDSMVPQESTIRGRLSPSMEPSSFMIPILLESPMTVPMETRRA